MENFKYSSKVSSKIPMVIKSLKKGIAIGKIIDDFEISCHSIHKIARENNLPVIKGTAGTPKKEKRDEKIMQLLIDGAKMVDVGKKFKITKARVQQVAKRNNFSSHEKRRKEKIKIAKNIHSSKKTYNEISNQFKGNLYRSPKKNARYSKYSILKTYEELYGINLLDAERINRNRCIVNVFEKGSTAKEITNLDKPVILLNPKKVTTQNYVYILNRKAGKKRYPNVGSRVSGMVFEDKKIINKIVKLRSKNLSYEKIAKELNDLELNTIQGFEFKAPNVRAKYLRYQKDNS